MSAKLARSVGILCALSVIVLTSAAQAAGGRTIHIAVVDAVGQPLDGVQVEVQADGTPTRLIDGGNALWLAKDVTASSAGIVIHGPANASADIKVDLPGNADVGVIIRHTANGTRAEVTDAANVAALPGIGLSSAMKARPAPSFDAPATKDVGSGGSQTSTSLAASCPGALFSNIGYDAASNALSHTRNPLDRWVVDDVSFVADTTITDISWAGNEPNTFNWSGQLTDYLILANDGPGGSPGTIVAAASDVPATRVNTGDVLFGDPVWQYTISGLNINLTAGTYWVAGRVVQSNPVGGGQFDLGWWVTATASSGGQAYYNFGASTPGWDPISAINGTPYDMAFCVYGFQGAPPFGACCDNFTGVCEDCVQGTCPSSSFFFGETACGDLNPVCGEITGACCDIVVGGCVDVPPSQCTGPDVIFQGEYTSCATPGVCPCVVPCPVGSTPEGEPPCGEDYDDQFNGGCNTLPTPVFSPVACGDTICGEAGTYLADLTCTTSADCPLFESCTGGICTGGPYELRDTDWYEITIAAETYVTWSVEAEFPVAAFIADGNAGCASVPVIVSATGGECEKVDISACLLPGTYYLLVLPSVFTGIDCSSDYTVSLTCENCPTGACCPGDGSCLSDVSLPACNAAGGLYVGDTTVCTPNPCPQNDSCAVAEPLAVPGSVVASNVLATNDATGTCGTSAPGHGLWYEIVGTGNTITIDTCGAGTDHDTKIQVFCDCGFSGCVGGNDDSCGLSSSVSFCSELGQTYYVHVGGFSTASGTFEVTTTDGAACGSPVTCEGACCLGTTCDSTTDPTTCSGLGGDWYQGETCPAFNCPLPVREDCPDAYVIPSVPFAGSVDNNNATADGPSSYPDCGDQSSSATVMQNDVWFEYTPPADCLLSVEVNPTTYDGIGAIWSGTCAGLVFETCGDEPEPYSMFVNALGGVTYYIQLGDWGTSEGGGITDFTINCANTTGACCFGDGSCSELNAADCSLAGGSYSGDGTTCTPNLCPQPPSNDNCVTADPLSVPGNIIVSNDLATDDPESTATCGTGSLNQAVWYTVVGDGTEFTATTCNPGGSFNDTKLQVWCRNCGALICVGGDDDDTCTYSNLRSRVTWCTSPGTTYYIAVGGYGTNEGDIELSVAPGAACGGAIDCNPPAAYCASNATSTADSLCEDVALNGWNNNTAGVCAAYSDFTGAAVTTLTQGDPYQVDVTAGTCGGCYGKRVKVFIDWNQDLDFADPGEQVYYNGANTTTCPQTVSGNFNVPLSASLGDTRMRVIVREGSTEPSACGTYTWGETEDYTISIAAKLDVQGPWDDDDTDDVPNFCDNCPDDANTDQADADLDGAGDVCDICPGFDDFADADGDTVPDGCDVCPGFDDNADADNDTVADGCDNCPNRPNTNQADGDNDGVGNLCDNCPNNANANQLDSDGDGNGNVCDLCPGFDDYDDADGDGVPGNGTGCDQCPDANDGATGALGDDDGDGVLNCNDLCNGVDDAVFAPGCVGQIPAASEWGLLVLALVLLVGGKLYFGRRQALA